MCLVLCGRRQLRCIWHVWGSHHGLWVHTVVIMSVRGHAGIRVHLFWVEAEVGRAIAHSKLMMGG